LSVFLGFRGRFQKKKWGFWHDFYRFGMKSARSRVSVGQCQPLMNEKRQKPSVGAVCGDQKVEKSIFAHACLKQTRTYGGCNMSYKPHDSCSAVQLYKLVIAFEKRKFIYMCLRG
jgi:hypothetical protein